MSQTLLHPPPLQDQERYWNHWNLESRVGRLGPYETRLRDVAAGILRRHAGAKARILEVGCGSGWMSQALQAYGPVVGIDLSSAAIDIARQRCPDARFVCGDFLAHDLPGPFDVAVTADTLAHVADQQGFVDRVAELLAPGALFVLMTQNSYAYERSAWVPPPAPGQIRRWPKIPELRSMLGRDFRIKKITTAAPGGATDGIFRLLNSRRAWRGLCKAFGTERMTRLYERCWFGNELVVIARRR